MSLNLFWWTKHEGLGERLSKCGPAFASGTVGGLAQMSGLTRQTAGAA